MNSSLLRSDPIAIRLIIGSSRSAVMPVHVLRGHRGVVDDHACGLGGRTPGRRADVVDRGRREPGQRGNVVEKSEQTGAHGSHGSRLPTATSLDHAPMSDSIQPRAK